MQHTSLTVDELEGSPWSLPLTSSLQAKAGSATISFLHTSAIFEPGGDLAEQSLSWAWTLTSSAERAAQSSKSEQRLDCTNS